MERNIEHKLEPMLEVKLECPWERETEDQQIFTDAKEMRTTKAIKH